MVAPAPKISSSGCAQNMIASAINVLTEDAFIRVIMKIYHEDILWICL